MDTNELLVRTLNAAKEARKKGFYNTADAFEEIVENLLALLDAQSQSTHETRMVSPTESHHIH